MKQIRQDDHLLSLECHELSAPEEWDALVRQTGAEIYFLSNWQKVWWHHYGSDFSPSRKAACFILRNGGQVVGVLPFCLETIWAGPVPVRVARLAGVDSNFAVMTLPIAAGMETEALTAVFSFLVHDLRCTTISLSPLSQQSQQLEPIRAACSGCDAITEVRYQSDRGHTLMHLPDNPDVFMTALSKSRRREVRRDLKRLTRDETLGNTCSTPDTLDDMMDRFIDLHTRQWEAAGKGGHFSDWRVAAAFYRALLHQLAPHGQAAIDEQWLGDTLLSSQLRFTLGTKTYWWLNARSVDPRFNKVGLGRVGLVERAEDLINAGTRLVEAGAGKYEYKLSYGGELVPLHSLVLTSTRPVARLQARALLLWADTLHLLYYRLWFLKIRPRLNTRPRPLWTAWIRTRL